MFSRNTAGILCRLICVMMRPTSRAEASDSVDTPCGEMNSMP
jgi:hypothetical protein